MLRGLCGTQPRFHLSLLFRLDNYILFLIDYDWTRFLLFAKNISMKLHIPLSLKKALLTVLALNATTQAGHMNGIIDYQTYRNLGENRGPFTPGATDVTVYDINGDVVGVIPVVPDFSAVSNPGTAASLGGGQSWLVDCEHNRVIETIQWGVRLGTYNTPVFEEYRNINRVEANYAGWFDLSISRLSKVVTDVVHWEIARDPRYTSDKAFLEDKYIWRVGAGGQKIYTYPDAEGEYLNSAYETITAGTGRLENIGPWYRTVSNERGETLDVHIDNHTFGPLNDKDKENMMPVLGWGGDSGSPVIVYNEDTKSFQLIGIFYGYNFRGGTVWDDYHTYNFHSEEFYDFVIDSSAYSFDKTETKWTFGASNSEGFVDVTAGTLVDYDNPIRTLKQGERGDTRTVGTLASNEEMWATLDWVFESESNTTLHFEGSFDAGAGTFQFNRGEGATAADPTTYTITADSADVHVSSGGYIVQEHVSVSTTLTGKAGDDWRIVGENARMSADANGDLQYEIYGGYFEIKGTGDNLADLNLGVGITVFLNREGSFQAANNVQLNTGSVVKLGSSTQIGGNVEFGYMGGLVDLNGHAFSRNSSNLFILDHDAGFANYAQDTMAKLSYTIQGAVHEDIHASFSDSTSLFAGGTGILNVDLIADTVGASATLDNHISMAGSFVLDGVNTTLSGQRVEIANPDETVNNKDYEPAYAPDQWKRVEINVGQLVARNNIHLELGPHVDVISNDLLIESGSTLRTTSTSTFTGTMNIHGAATFDEGSVITGAVSLHEGGTLDVTQGGVFDVDFTIGAGASALFGTHTELQGLLTNAGTVNFTDSLSISETMVNTGSLIFASDILFDITNLTGVSAEGVTTYQVFTGSTSSSFASLTSNNIVGLDSENLKWTFHDDGRLVASTLSSELTFTGGSLGLEVGVGGFVSGNYQDNSAIHFITSSTVMTLQAELNSDRLFVDGVSLDIISNGFTINVDRILMSDGASLTIRGEALQAAARATRQNDTRNTTIHIDAQGAALSDKNWLQEYTGHVEISNGSYDAGYTAAGYLSLLLSGENTAFSLQGASDLSFALRGDGTLHATGAAEIAFHDIDEFSGRIVSDADKIDFNTASAASIALVAQNNLHLNATGSYSGEISGAGHVFANESGISITALNNLTGTLNHTTGTLSVSGQSLDMDHFSMGTTGQVNILAGSHIRTDRDEVRRVSDFTINVAEGAHLEETLIHQYVSGGTLTLSGGGTVSWEGLMLSSENAQGNLVVDTGTTLHLLSGQQLRNPIDTVSFMLSNYNYHNQVTIRGTIITEGNLVTGSGYATLSVEDGGTLEIKKGLIIDSGHRGASYIRVRDGGTLLIGNQVTYGKDYGDPNWSHRLETYLESGATLGISGTGVVTTPNTFRWIETGHVNIQALEGQDFRLQRDILGERINILGGGIVGISGINVTTLNVAAGTELDMNSASVALQNFELDGLARINVAHTADYAISGAATGELRFTDRLEAKNMTGYAGTVYTAENSEFILHSSMQAGAKLIVAEDSHVTLTNAASFSNSHSETRTGNHHFTVDAGASLSENNINYQLSSGKTLTVDGSGQYRAGSIQLSGESLILGADSNASFASLSTTGDARVNFAQGSKLSADTATIASGQSLELSGAGTFSGMADVAGQVSFLAGAAQQGQMTLSGENAQLSFSKDSSLTGTVTLNGANSQLDLSQGGMHSGHIILNDGRLSIDSQLSLTHAIQGSASAELLLGNNIIFDIGNMSSSFDEEGAIIYTIFTGMSNDTFGSLLSNNVVGANSLNYDWVFNSNGTLRGTAITGELSFAGGNLTLIDGATGFDDGKSFSDNAKINFYGSNASLAVGEAGLKVDRVLVTGVQLDIQASGQQLNSGNIILTEGASLLLRGDVLSSSSLIFEEAAALHTEVILNINGGELAARDWFKHYTGKLSFQNGSYHLSAEATNYREAEIAADATLLINDISHIANSISGSGVIQSSAAESVSFDDLRDFSGTLQASASTINLHSTTSASFAIGAASTVNLSASGGLYDGTISGAGVLSSNSAGATTTVQQLGADFTGSVHLQSGTLELGGAATTISSIALASNSSLHLLANTNISASTTGYRQSRDYSIHLAEGSTLEERGLILNPKGGNFTLSGSGTYVVKGLELGTLAEANIVEIGANSTLHIASDAASPGSVFLVSNLANITNSIKIYGTLISDVAVKANYGKGNIDVYDGGTLVLNKGGMYEGINTYADPYVSIHAGGLLLMGNQDDTFDYGAPQNSLGLHLWDGSTIGGTTTGTINIYHTLWGAEGSTEIVNIWSQAKQTLHFHRAIKHQNLHIYGGGAVSIHNNGVVHSYSIADGELNFLQESLSISSLAIQGQASISMGADALVTRSGDIGTGVLTTTELRIDAGAENSLHIDNSIASLNMGNANINNRGNMSVTARDTSVEASASGSVFENIHLANADISDVANIILVYTQLSNSSISNTNFNVNDENIVQNSTIGEGVRFGFRETGSLTIENSTITHMDDNLFVQVVRNENIELRDILLVRNSTLQIQSESISHTLVSLPDLTLNLYSVDGVSLLLDEATIEGELIIELMGLELSSFENSSYGIEVMGLPIGSTHDLSQLSWRVQGEELEFNSLMSNAGNIVLVYEHVVPEPSTVSLSLLALASMLARRRRKKA